MFSASSLLRSRTFTKKARELGLTAGLNAGYNVSEKGKASGRKQKVKEGHCSTTAMARRLKLRELSRQLQSKIRSYVAQNKAGPASKPAGRLGKSVYEECRGEVYSL